MNLGSQFSTKPEIGGLVEAFVSNHEEDALNRAVTVAQWELLATYMQAFSVKQSEVVIKQGALDRTLFFVESGNLTVHYEDAAEQIRLAKVGPGSVLGEGGFFSHLPRNATVQAASDCKLWSITPMRFAEVSRRQPAATLALAMALGSIVCKRMQDRRRRIAVT
jgi:CRP-like cAMP-binding protein